MDIPHSTEDHFFRLSDGRVLAYREYGDPHGYPVFLFHGIPGSRRGVGLIGSQAGERGIRVICPDRPGIGLSTFQPNRGFLDWPEDVRELAGALGFERFGVVGNSGGSAYVLSCGVVLPERIEFAGIISGMGPVDFPDWKDWLELPRLQRMLVALARRAPLLACRIAGPVLARDFDPRRPGALERMKRSMSTADAALLDDPLVAEAVLTDAAEAIRQGTLGVAWDIMLYSQPWGFQLEEVKVPVHLWHGEADITVPAHFGRAMAEVLERCEATFWPDEGHLMCASRATDIIDVVTATVSSLRAQRQDSARRRA